MKLNVLFDLDDTLLSNNMDQFIPAYLQGLSRSFDKIPPQKTIQGVLSATGLMVRNQDPSLTLENVFDNYFYPEVGFTKQELQEKINHFYAEDFGKLQSLTSPRPESLEVVKYALHQGHTVVIATNPLFPRVAILQRLDWAGLTPYKDQISIVTTYESFHFSKPNIEYLAEILAQLGWNNQPTVLIGNSYEDDIIPAVKLGINAFWLNDGTETKTFKSDLITNGKIKQVIPWLEKMGNSGFANDQRELNTLLAILTSTPAAIHTHINNYAKFTAGLNHKNQPLFEIVNYLRSLESEINSNLIDMSLAGNSIKAQYPDFHNTPSVTKQPDQDLFISWKDFSTERVINLNKIKILSSQEQTKAIPSLEQIAMMDRKMIRLIHQNM
jgi:FMN phosphatase YigB (HAD superfamily)